VQVLGAPIAAGILKGCQGVAGMHGWQWLFLVEGIPTALLGLYIPVLLPRSPARARWLTPEQAEAVEAEVSACRGSAGMRDVGSVTALLRTAFTLPPVYLLGSAKFAKDLTSYGFMFWAPALIHNLLHQHQEGGDSCDAWSQPGGGVSDTGYVEVLLTGIPYSLAAAMNLAFAWHSQVRRATLLAVSRRA
jgi:sugar phosphate permease